MDKHFEENKISHDIVVAAEDDSILDFKSPEQFFKKQLTEFSHSNIHQKKKPTVKSNNIIKNPKDMKHKKCLKKKRNLQESQASIESSFFKIKNNCNDKDSTNDVKVALVCPLCFKTFKDLNSRTLHMKNCAYKNNIPMRKLLDAIELQKRQEDERKSLGLLAAPMVQDRKKSASSRRTSSCEETDLQLALALSKSLQEAEELDKINEIEGLPKALNHFALETDEAIYKAKKGQLEKFGFANSKPPVLIKNKKKKNNEITLLQTRSQEERHHILTERISEILMGNESVTQNQKEEIKYNYTIRKKTYIKSHLLEELCNKEEELWNKAKLSSNQNCFYVSNLSEHITVEEKHAVSKKAMILEYANTCNIHDMDVDQYKAKSCSNEEMHETSCTKLCFINEEHGNVKNRQFISRIIKNWGDTLNDSSASDIIIFVNNDKHIWAHKLVFYVQCSNILLDVTSNDTLLFTNIKEKICWTSISYNIALAFLEFIYCGIIEKYLSVLQNLTNISFLRNLARRYKIEELFVFLQKKEIEIKQTKSQMHKIHKQELIFKEKDKLELNIDNAQNGVYDSQNFKLNDKKKFDRKYSEKCIINKSEFIKQDSNENTHTEELIQEEINYSVNTNIIRNSNLSPDLFDDVNDIINNKELKNKIHDVNEIIDLEQVKDYENFNMLDSVNKVTIDNDNFCRSGNTTVTKNIEEDINSLSNTSYYTTPKKGNRSNVPKLRNNLSIFIEQFQQENAKLDLDIDTEISILPTCSKLCRNPFKVKQYDSPEYPISQINTTIKEIFKTENVILDRFDCVTNSKLDMKMPYKTSDTKMCIDFESVDNIIQLSESNVEESIEKDKNYSISKSINNPYKELQDDAVSSVSEDSFKENVKNSKNLQNVSQYDADFYISEDEMSMYSKYKKGHENNSIAKYRSFVQKHILTNNVKDDTIHNEYDKKYNKDMLVVDTDKDLQLKTSPLKKYVSEVEEKRLNSNYKQCKQIFQQTPYSFSNECDEYNYPFTNVISPLSIQKNIPENTKMNNLSKLRHSKSESNIGSQMVRRNSFILEKLNTDNYNSVESPILISSSPELDYNLLSVHKHKGKKLNENVSHLEKFENNSHVFENAIYLANVSIDKNDKNSITSSVTKKVNQLDEKIIASNENNKLITTDFFVKESKDNEKSLTTKKYDTKFQRKSISETSLHINTQSIDKHVSEFYNNFQCKCDYNKKIILTTSPETIRDSITPPPNYNDMETSELQAELNKYGLKIQKRKRAVKLLTYIYDQLHPVCTTSKNVESELTVLSSEDEEPPMKKINNGKNDVAGVFNYESELSLSPINTGMQSPINIITDKKQFDEDEFTLIINDTSNIKDMFSKILTVKKELHNKILNYEPLCINSLYSMLKTEGFKCKMNTLMDFLDEQCITFYVQETKQNKKN